MNIFIHLYYFSRGQLGLGSTNTEETPTLIDALAGIKIVDIACGAWHSAAVSAFGDLYVWGWNVNGQLGRPVYKESTITYTSGRTEPIRHKVASVFPVPHVVDLPKALGASNSNSDPLADCSAGNDERLQDQYEVVRVVCGARHTIVHTGCDRFLVSGWNKYGQCAIGDDNDDDKDISVFREIENIPNAVKKVLCGRWCTIFTK